MSKIDTLLATVDTLTARSDRIASSVAEANMLISLILHVNSSIASADGQIDSMTSLINKSNICLNELEKLYEKSYYLESNLHVNEAYISEASLDSLAKEYEYVLTSLSFGGNGLQNLLQPMPPLPQMSDRALKNKLSLLNLELKPIRCKQSRVQKQKSRYRLSAAYTLNPVQEVRNVLHSSRDTYESSVMDHASDAETETSMEEESEKKENRGYSARESQPRYFEDEHTHTLQLLQRRDVDLQPERNSPQVEANVHQEHLLQHGDMQQHRLQLPLHHKQNDMQLPSRQKSQKSPLHAHLQPHEPAAHNNLRPLHLHSPDLRQLDLDMHEPHLPPSPLGFGSLDVRALDLDTLDDYDFSLLASPGSEDSPESVRSRKSSRAPKVDDIDNFHRYLRRSRIDLQAAIQRLPLERSRSHESVFLDAAPIQRPTAESTPRFHNPTDRIVAAHKGAVILPPTVETVYLNSFEQPLAFRDPAHHDLKALSLKFLQPEAPPVTPKKNNFTFFSYLNSPARTDPSPSKLDRARRGSVEVLGKSLASGFRSLVAPRSDALPAQRSRSSPPEKIKQMRRDIREPISACSDTVCKRLPPQQTERQLKNGSHSSLTIGPNKTKIINHGQTLLFKKPTVRRMSLTLLREALNDSILF